MREIKFRGKSLEIEEWVYGSLVINTYTKECSILYFDAIEHAIHYSVDPTTVGQSNGLKDKNGTEIYEGDIITDGYRKSEVIFNHGAFVSSIFCDGGWFEDLKDIEVVGNIHDNPELFGGVRA